MNDTVRTALIRVPVTMKIGPLPDDVTSHSQVSTFALAHFTRLVRKANEGAAIDGEKAIVSYSPEGTLQSFTIAGASLDGRHYRLQPEGDLHKLEISEDQGKTFAFAANFADYDLARRIGDAWVDGRTETAA